MQQLSQSLVFVLFWIVNSCNIVGLGIVVLCASLWGPSGDPERHVIVFSPLFLALEKGQGSSKHDAFEMHDIGRGNKIDQGTRNVSRQGKQTKIIAKKVTLDCQEEKKKGSDSGL